MGEMHEPQKGRSTKTQHILRFPRLIRRFPRRNAEEVAYYRTANQISELEKKAAKWIARGREANTKLGRVFIRLKKLVGYGNFEKYFDLKFGKPYGIAFRTAQVYMQLARTASETKGADSAPFPPAMDPQAMEIREATKEAGMAVARANRQIPNNENSDYRERVSEHTKQCGSATCTSRISIRMTPDQRDSVSALWRSKHRAAAEAAVTDLLMELCKKHGISSSDPPEEETDA